MTVPDELHFWGGERELIYLFVLNCIILPCSDQVSKASRICAGKVLGLGSGQQHSAHLLLNVAEDKGDVALV